MSRYSDVWICHILVYTPLMLVGYFRFPQSLLVAEAYKKRDICLWVDAVYNQVIMKGNFSYLQDMRSALSLTSNLYVDVATK